MAELVRDVDLRHALEVVLASHAGREHDLGAGRPTTRPSILPVEPR